MCLYVNSPKDKTIKDMESDYFPCAYGIKYLVNIKSVLYQNIHYLSLGRS